MLALLHLTETQQRCVSWNHDLLTQNNPCYEQFRVCARFLRITLIYATTAKDNVHLGAKFCGWGRAVTLTCSWMSWQMIVNLFKDFKTLRGQIMAVSLGITEAENVCTETDYHLWLCVNRELPFLIIHFRYVFPVTHSALAWVHPFATCCHIWWVDP